MPATYATVVDAFRETARNVPDAIALRGSFGTVTFRELDHRVEGLAEELRRRGIGPEDRVAICLERSPALIVALLGVLASGAAYVPIDPDYPIARNRTILDDCQPSLILGGFSAETGTVDQLEPTCWPRQPDHVCDDRPGMRDAAYIIYTSGSTGVPKGVVIEHAALANYLAWSRESLPSSGGGAPLFATIAFDHAVTCIFPPLLAGEPVTLLPSIEGGRALAGQLLNGHHYSFVKITPSHVRTLTIEQRAALGASADMVMLGGEAGSAELVRQLRRDALNLPVLNHYGPTEATVGCCVYQVPLEQPEESLPIGTPIPGASARITDAGELLIGGACLARGYWQRPDLDTATYAEIDGERWYRSGDLVRERADGALAYLGRLDDQIKILGHRIEPGEIETALRRCDGVSDAAVIPDDGGIIAAIAPPGDTSQIRDALRALLPPAMIPSRFVMLDALPVTINGKLDRQAILDRLESPPPVRNIDDIESALLQTWRDTLSIRDITLDDDFFELGGDSLASVEIVTWAESTFGVELELAALFEHPTIRTLANAIRESGGP
jgi:amino acid adenylation domain-containing protein